MSSKEEQLSYIRNYLILEILGKLPGKILVNSEVKKSENLDGFMSALYELNLIVKDTKNNEETSLHIIVKLMTGNELFRESSKSYPQFSNEILIYSKVLPYYEEIVAKSKSSINVRGWVPYVYFAKYGKIEGLGNGSSAESVLALDYLKPQGYRGGPRLYLDRQHLLLMAKSLAEYHSLTYAMRLKKDPQLQKFIEEIIPLPFVSEKDGEENLYDVNYKAAFQRFFQYFDKTKDTCDETFIRNVEKLRKYKTQPTLLLEKFREINETFSVILHGDYNRNNVLFQYDDKESFDNPKNMKMIDFQELRYGTPAIDLAFFMYMNMNPDIRDSFWMELLQFYHQTLLESLAAIMGVHLKHEILEPYSFKKFYEHFSRFSFYGTLVCMHFLPWMYGTEEECSQLARLFIEDVHGEAYMKISIEAGGDRVNEIIMNVVKHASRVGYMDTVN